jgi:hypothetical protein
LRTDRVGRDAARRNRWAEPTASTRPSRRARRVVAAVGGQNCTRGMLCQHSSAQHSGGRASLPAQIAGGRRGCRAAPTPRTTRPPAKQYYYYYYTWVLLSTHGVLRARLCPAQIPWAAPGLRETQCTTARTLVSTTQGGTQGVLRKRILITVTPGGGGERSPGADVAGLSPVPVQMWTGASPVQVWMWAGVSPTMDTRHCSLACEPLGPTRPALPV